MALVLFAGKVGKVAAIAAATTKEAIGQPLFAVVIVLALGLMLLQRRRGAA